MLWRLQWKILIIGLQICEITDQPLRPNRNFGHNDKEKLSIDQS